MDTPAEKSSRPGSSSSSRRRLIVTGLLVVILILYALVNYRLVTVFDYLNNDFAALWTAGRVMAEGKNPYDSANILPIYQQLERERVDTLITGFAYPLWTGFIFAPLGLFSLTIASTIWTIFNQVCVIITFWLIIKLLTQELKGADQARAFQMMLLGGFVLFIPSQLFVETLFNGQLSFLITLLLTLFIYGVSRQNYALAGLGLLAIVIKITPLIIFAPVALLWLLPKERRLGLYTFFGATAILALLSFAININWVQNWLGARTGEGWRVIKEVSTVWGLMGAFADGAKAPDLLPWLAGATTLLILGISLFTYYRQRTRNSTVAFLNPPILWGWLIILSITLTFYSYPYESVLLLIPLLGIIFLIRNFPRPYQIVTFIDLGFIFWYLPWQINGYTLPGSDVLAVLTPLTLLGLILVLAYFQPRLPTKPVVAVAA